MALIDIKNEAQLDSLFADNTSGNISALSMRQFVASVAPYGGVMKVGLNAVYPITATPVNIDFDSYNIPGNDLMTFDLIGNKCDILAGGIYYITWRLNGDWSVGVDVKLHVYLNGIADPFALSDTKGLGSGNPISVSVSQYPIAVTQQDVIDGGGLATIELRISESGGGSTTINLVHTQMEVNYATLTKDIF